MSGSCVPPGKRRKLQLAWSDARFVEGGGAMITFVVVLLLETAIWSNVLLDESVAMCY